mmetsp:Transcript_43034/g.113040  ORF Transcript_43034/g.113040 Transcript_43034/m.113040 type:complete len:106 (-) Transcript_43034:188-505(-)
MSPSEAVASLDAFLFSAYFWNLRNTRRCRIIKTTIEAAETFGLVHFSALAVDDRALSPNEIREEMREEKPEDREDCRCGQTGRLLLGESASLKPCAAWKAHIEPE